MHWDYCINGQSLNSGIGYASISNLDAVKISNQGNKLDEGHGSPINSESTTTSRGQNSEQQQQNKRHCERGPPDESEERLALSEV